MKTREAIFNRILDNAPAMFTSAQLRVFLRALISLDPYDFAEDVATYFVGDDENNQQTPGEVLVSTLTSLPDEKITGFALRLALTGHTDIPREGDFDFLAEAEIFFVPPNPRRELPQRRSRRRNSTRPSPKSRRR